MKYHQLRALVAVAEYGSIRAAARSLYLSQAALTKAIKELEQELQLPLLERTARGAELTEFGQRLRVRAQMIVGEMRRAQEDIAQMKGTLTGSVAAAISPATALTFLPAAFRAFRRRLPDAKVSLFEGFLSTSLPRLRDGTLDFVVAVALPERLGAEFSHSELYSSAMAVVARAGHPLAKCTSLAQLQEAEWVLNPTAESTNQKFLECLMAHGVAAPLRVTECPSALIAHALIRQGDVLAAIPAQLLEVDWFKQNLVALPLAEELPRMSFRVITRRDSPLTPAAALLVDCLWDAARRRN